MKNFFDKLIEEYFGNIDPEVKIIFKHSEYFFSNQKFKINSICAYITNQAFRKRNLFSLT